MDCIVLDSGPTISLSVARKLEALQYVAAKVIIPPAVHEEVVSKGSGRHGAMDVEALVEHASWFRVIAPQRGALLRDLQERLGITGEAEALVLAKEFNATIIIDELKGRACARELGLDMSGSLGLLARLKNLNIITEVGTSVKAMRKAGVWFGETLTNRFLREMGE